MKESKNAQDANGVTAVVDTINWKHKHTILYTISSDLVCVHAHTHRHTHRSILYTFARSSRERSIAVSRQFLFGVPVHIYRIGIGKDKETKCTAYLTFRLIYFFYFTPAAAPSSSTSTLVYFHSLRIFFYVFKLVCIFHSLSLFFGSLSFVCGIETHTKPFVKVFIVVFRLSLCAFTWCWFVVFKNYGEQYAFRLYTC